MSTGLPVLVTDVGGLAEAAADYDGLVLVAPDDRTALVDGLGRLCTLVGSGPFADNRSWATTVDAYLRRIRAKLNISTTAEMTRLAISMGL